MSQEEVESLFGEAVDALLDAQTRHALHAQRCSHGLEAPTRAIKEFEQLSDRDHLRLAEARPEERPQECALTGSR